MSKLLPERRGSYDFRNAVRTLRASARLRRCLPSNRVPRMPRLRVGMTWPYRLPWWMRLPLIRRAYLRGYNDATDAATRVIRPGAPR